MSSFIKHVLILFLVGVQIACSSGGTSDPEEENPVVTSGLDARPVNTSCLAVSYTPGTDIRLTRIFSNLSFNRPLLMLKAPDNTDRWYIVEQGGEVFWIDATNEATTVKNTMLSISDANISSYLNTSGCNECGLLGMAFDPDFAGNGYVYLSFTAPENDTGTSETMQSFVSRFTSNDGGLTLDVSSRTDILNVLQPYSNHNGGHIGFGSDGFLYVALGDGGSGDDPDNHGQSTDTLLGSMLRLNTDGSPAAGNVLAGSGALAEIYAYGLRNPWRWSFDRQTGELWLGDVGQVQYEEVDIIVNGGNYGWRCREGLHVTSNSCSTSGPYIDPVAEYGRSEGISITGGYVYRGSAIPGINGVYLFADFGSGTIWGLFPQTGNQYDRRVLVNSGLNISSFAEDQNGEIYLTAFETNLGASNGALYRIDEDTSSSGPSGPASNLSETGCVNLNDPTQPASGLIAYDINEPFWSDGALKQRYFALPENTMITLDSDGDFLFPVGSVLMKNFSLNGQLIETRLFMQESTDNWQGYSYQWNSAQTEAMLLSNVSDVVMGSQTWHYPSSGECLQCHTNAANFSLGLEMRQLNSDFVYPSTGVAANQLTTLQHIGVLATDLPSVVNNPLASSNDVNIDLESRARSYLHSNCSNCHRPGGTSQSNMDLRISVPFSDMNICNQAPLNGDLGISGAMIMLPGTPAQSVLLQRINSLNQNRMPPTSSNVIDAEGVQLINDWIVQRLNCF